jgi:Protein of unknown function (DUF2865)
MRRRALFVAATLAVTAALAPRTASAENLFDFFFGGAQKHQRQAAPLASFFADPMATDPQPATPPRPVVASSGPAFCVRSCDGRYFPLMRSSASPVQMCQAFCPASPTKVFFGSSIDGAISSTGQRYADSENAFVYRKELRADCTCNGRNPAGLAPIDLTLDTSLRPGDVIATTDGLVAYSGVKVGTSQTAEFTPVASYPGLTAEVRARLGEMKVAPVATDIATDAPASAAASSVTSVLRAAVARARRAEAD